MGSVNHRKEAAMGRTLRTLARIAGSLAFFGTDFHWYRREIE
jgi:hypothetical protein